jgi:hypothetical protein
VRKQPEYASRVAGLAVWALLTKGWCEPPTTLVTLPLASEPEDSMRHSPATNRLPRRQFLTGTLAGVPFWLNTPVFAQQPDAAGADPVAQEILSEMIDAANNIERAPGDSARRQARALRMLAALGQKEGCDEIFRAQMRKEIRLRGRNEIIFERPALASAAREARRHGVRLDLSQITETNLDFERKSRALDTLVEHGLVASCRRHAAVLEALAPSLDQYRPVRLQSKLDQKCMELQDELFTIELAMGMSCLLSAFFAFWLAACTLYTVSYFSFRIYIRDSHPQCQ